MTAPATRRQLFGASAAMLLLVAPAAGAEKAAELDGELLAACAHYQRLEAAYRATGGTDEDMILPDSYIAAISAVADLPARSPEGLVAKAEAILAYREGRDLEEDEAYLGPHKALEWSLILDVAGRART